MNRFFITVNTKKAEDIGTIVNQIVEEEKFNLFDYDYRYAPDFESLILNNQEEIIEYITKDGFTDFVMVGAVNEDLVKVGATQSSVLNVLQKYLDKVGIDKELVIVDPYFYAPNPKNPDYILLLTTVLTKYLPTVSNLIIVTLPNTPTRNLIDLTMKSKIETSLKAVNPLLNIISVTSNNYHDRFWISNNRTKGILVGSSLNSLGNKYALVDRLNITDVREIITELKTEGLII